MEKKIQENYIHILNMYLYRKLHLICNGYESRPNECIQKQKPCSLDERMDCR